MSVDRDERARIKDTLAGPRWVQRTVLLTLAITSPIFKIARVIIFLMGVGGAAAIVVGVATLNLATVLGGLGQILLAGAVLAINAGTREMVNEVVGPADVFVIRTARRRAWRERHGWPAIAALIRGDRVWTVAVRHRRDDPFGHVVMRQTTGTGKEAMAAQRELEQRIRAGEALPEIR